MSTPEIPAKNSDYPGSYYAASASPAPQRPPLSGMLETDVCIVGGGYSGLSTALHLAESGRGVTVLEAARIGWGASGRNGGQVINGLNASLETIQNRYGETTAQYIGGMLQEGAGIIYGNIEKYTIQCDLMRGNIYAAFTTKHMRELEAKQALWRKFSMDDHELLDKAGIGRHVGTDAYCGGMIDHSGAHLHPLNLALGEARAIEENGGKIFEHSPVVSYRKHGTDCIATTTDGEIKCKHLVFCGNAYLGKVVPKLVSRVMPVSTQVMATEPLSEALANTLLPTGMCVEDVRYILDYYRLSADRRMLFGGGTVYGGSDPSDIKAKLWPNMLKIFPELKSTKIDYAWSGNFALSFSRVPQMGTLEDNVWFAHGYSGHGVTGSHLFGRVLAEAINGDRNRFDRFTKIPWIPFPGGRLLRVPYSTVGSWWYAFRDKLGV